VFSYNSVNYTKCIPIFMLVAWLVVYVFFCLQGLLFCPNTIAFPSRFSLSTLTELTLVLSVCCVVIVVVFVGTSSSKAFRLK
jgi:hypothetical protein